MIRFLENYTDRLFLCLLCMWLMQVTDTHFHPSLNSLEMRVRSGDKPRPFASIPPMLTNTDTCDWTVGHSLETPPLTSLVCGRRSEVL